VARRTPRARLLASVARRLPAIQVTGALGSERLDAHERRRAPGILAAALAHRLAPGRHNNEQTTRRLPTVRHRLAKHRLAATH